MRKFYLFFVSMFLTSIVFADPPAMDISSLLQQETSFGLELDIPGENGIKGCVGDFNDDGCDDFIVTGLYIADATTDPATIKGFFRVYLGQKVGAPVLAYNDEDFSIAGNGAIDCHKLEDGSFLVALQGGAVGNWENPFKGVVINLKVTDSEVDYDFVVELDYGAGRGSILLLDIDGDGHADIFQGGWNATGTWTNLSNVYINDGSDAWFEFEPIEDIRPAANNFVVKGDLDNDGKVDLVMAIQGVGVFAYYNNGDGSFEEVLVTPFSKEERDDGKNIRSEDDASQVELIDFDGDGLLDVILSGTNDNADRWEFVMELYKNNGDKTFSQIEHKDKAGNAVTFVGGQRADFAVADFDQDGKVDFILGVENQNDADAWGCRTFYMNGNGEGGFDQFDITFDEDTSKGIVPMSRRGNFGRFLVGDFDGNGTPDLVTVGTNYYARHPGMRIYYNTSTPLSGISDNDISPVSVYAHKNTLYVSNVANSQINLYNLAGVQVYQGMIKGNQATINIPVSPGVYVVKINDYVQKVIIK